MVVVVDLSEIVVVIGGSVFTVIVGSVVLRVGLAVVGDGVGMRVGITWRLSLRLLKSA